MTLPTIHPSRVTSDLIMLIAHARQMRTERLVGGAPAAAMWREGEVHLADALERFAAAIVADPVSVRVEKRVPANPAGGRVAA